MKEIGYTKSWRKKYSGKTASRGLLYVGAMDWLVGNANLYDRWADGQKCERGQLYIGRADLARVWKVSEQTVRTILKNLEKDGFLTSKSTNKGTIVTVSNYNTYQSVEERNQPANQPATNQQDFENRKKSTSKSTNGKEGVTDSLSSNKDTSEKDNQPANQPATNQQDEQNQPLNKNKSIYIYKREQPNQIDEKPQSAWTPNGIPPPTKPEEVKTEAIRIGYAMTDERAVEFLSHYQTLGWRLNGGYIIDWRKLLPRWKNNENRKGAMNNAKQSDYENDSRGRKRIANADEFTGIQNPSVI
jgi:DNA-binding PadR family transcriptional regulator